MNTAVVIGVVIAILAGAFATICWMGLIVAGMPNSSPAQLVKLWRFFWIVCAGGMACAAGAIVLLIYGRPGISASVALAPLAAFIVFMVVALAMPS
jgi:hypothetical protein